MGGTGGARGPGSGPPSRPERVILTTGPKVHSERSTPCITACFSLATSAKPPSSAKVGTVARGRRSGSPPRSSGTTTTGQPTKRRSGTTALLSRDNLDSFAERVGKGTALLRRRRVALPLRRARRRAPQVGLGSRPDLPRLARAANAAGEDEAAEPEDTEPADDVEPDEAEEAAE